MESFHAKIVWKRPRKRENKNYHFVPFLPDTLQKIPKKLQKNKKRTPLWHHFKPKYFWKRQRKRENKNYSFVPSLPDAKFKIAKKFKKIKHPSMASFKATIG